MTTVQGIERRVLTPCRTLVRRGEIPVADMVAWLDGAFHAVADHLKRVDVEPVGRPFARFAVFEGTIAVEAGFPVPHDVRGEPGIDLSALPGGPAVVAEHLGRYQDADHAYSMVRTWLHTHGYVAAGSHWEVFHTDPVFDPDAVRWRTEIVQPYRA